MPELEIQPFSDEHIPEAAALLEERHNQHRAVEPGLPANVDFRAEIEALWSMDERSGTAAIRAGELVGYLLGAHRDESWGPNMWVELAGHAVREPELVRDLYAVAAEEWVARGRDAHYALVPATDPGLVDAWFRLSFGAQHAAGIQETPESSDSPPPSVVVRRAVAEDVDAATALELELPRHQGRSPVFSRIPAPAGITNEQREEFLSDIDDPEIGLFVAEIDGKLVGELLMVPVERSSMHSGLARPERAAFLPFAATLPETRGSGAGLALTNAGLAWAREQGYPVTVVDWRETNLLASRFWPARGFRRTFLRLYRSIP
jgi:ribosomal protein S18 acetylase RimI-like enzyme